MTQDAGALLKLADEIEHHAKTSAPLDEASFLLRNKMKFVAALRQAASQGSVGGEVPICCYCDNTLCCAHCGKEQPADASPPVKKI